MAKKEDFIVLENNRFIARILEKREMKQLLHYTAVRENHEGWSLVALTGNEEGKVEWLKTVISGKDPSIHSLGTIWPAALWLEREITDRTGIEMTGRPKSRPLLYPEKALPEGVAHGSGTFHMPLGPVRGDVMESIVYMFDLLGEQIMFLDSQLFYKHRAIEDLAKGMAPEQALQLAERIGGTSTVAHAAAFAAAAEQAAEIDVSVRTVQERLLLGELERLYNHAHDIGQLAGATGMSVGQAQMARIKEELLRINADLSGSRFLRGTVHIGRPSTIDWKIHAELCQKKLNDIARRFNRFTFDLSRTSTFIDRLQGTGKTDLKWVREFDVVGPVARASGIFHDARFDYSQKSLNLGSLQLMTDLRNEGDALGRYKVRVDEWKQSLEFVRLMLAFLEDPEWGLEKWQDDDRISPEKWGLGIVESPRGRTNHLVHIDSDRKISFWNVRSASGCNWPIFGLAAANGNIQTDFPIIETSFALSVASCDR